jgi:hypothetical protein
VTLRARWVTLRARWVTLRARWVTLRDRWVTLRDRWVTLRDRWVTLRLSTAALQALTLARHIPCSPLPQEIAPSWVRWPHTVLAHVDEALAAVQLDSAEVVRRLVSWLTDNTSAVRWTPAEVREGVLPPHPRIILRCESSSTHPGVTGTHTTCGACPASPSRGGLPGLAGVTTRPAGHPSGGVPPAVERQLHLLTTVARGVQQGTASLGFAAAAFGSLHAELLAASVTGLDGVTNVTSLLRPVDGEQHALLTAVGFGSCEPDSDSDDSDSNSIEIDAADGPPSGDQAEPGRREMIEWSRCELELNSTRRGLRESHGGAETKKKTTTPHVAQEEVQHTVY